MNELTLPPSPNWYLSNILACAGDGTVAWGARHSIVIAKKAQNTSKSLDYTFIEKAHFERINSVAFSPHNDEGTEDGESDGTYRLVSSGEDNIVKVWNIKEGTLQISNSQLNSSHKIIGVDWSKCNKDLICFVSDNGLLVKWDCKNNTSKEISLGKMTATCIACCPHDQNIVAIGSKSGLIYIVDIHGSGNIIYKLRGHDVEVVSLSWCPVPVNIFQENNEKETLLASGAKDRHIFLWRAGSDGRYQTQLTFPNTPLDTNNHRCKVSASAGNYTAVCWLEPTMLLTSSPWGELLSWDLSSDSKKKFTPKLVHASHRKGLFSIAGFAEISSELPNDSNSLNWRNKTDIKGIWTAAQDRQIICCNIVNNEVTIDYNIPTQGGFVYCMSACPLDTSQIAFGAGDHMIRLWNLSEPHENTIEIQILWEKIKGKVRAISWHPEKENLLAFATDEGRIGIFDTNTKKTPILCRQYHRHTVYKIAWGPAPNIDGYALYSCGDGEVVYYSPDKYNENPISVTKKKNCTEFAWKSDFSFLALGFVDGSISFLNRDLCEYDHRICVLNKAVNCLVWHPESTSSDLNISPLKNYLAVACNDTPIWIFEILNMNNTEENKLDKASFYRTVAILHGHHDKVVTLAWSPHMSGYLVSGAYDYNSQVWNVNSQNIIATYISHKGPVMCCMWSPFSQDLIISGSGDFTLRIWSIKNQEILSTPPINIIKTRGKRTKKKAKKASDNTENENEFKSKVTNQETKMLTEEIEDMNITDQKIIKKRKLKKVSHFPGHAEIAKDNKRWCSAVRNLLHIVENKTQKEQDNEMKDHNGHSNGVDNIENGNIAPEKLIEEDSMLLGTKVDFQHALNYEKNLLYSNEHHILVTQIDFWTGNLKENLQEAAKNKRLNDYSVSLAPTISIEMWKKMCEAYAIQLSFDEYPHKAASYFLCINKVSEAIEVFITAKLFKEAYALARSRLEANDPIISNILKQWASKATNDGDFQSAIECYIKLGEYVIAAKLLERRGDVDSLNLAIDLANAAKDSDLSTSIIDKTMYKALLNSNISMVSSLIEKHPRIQHREIEMVIFDQLSKALEDASNEHVMEWLKGSTKINLLESLKLRFPANPMTYSLLLQRDVIPLPKSEKSVQIHVGHELALSILSATSEQQLKHILKAFDVIVQYDEKHEVPLLLKYISVLENKSLEDSNNIFNNSDNGIGESLHAYLCYAVIDWFHRIKIDENQFSECVSSIVYIIDKYVKDLFNKDLVNFYTEENAMKQLESELSSTFGKHQDSEEDNGDKTKALIKRLNHLKCGRKQFIETRVASPSPLYILSIMDEVLCRIPDEQVKMKIVNFVSNLPKETS